MANTDYSVTRNDIITEALEYLGALGEGDTPSADQVTSLGRTLNMLIKHWQGDSVNIYTIRETFLFLVDGVGKYDQLDFNGTTGLDVDRNHIYVSDYQRVAFSESSTTEVTINESFISGSPVDSAVVGDVIGIPLDDGTMHWAAITAVGTSGSFSKSFTFADNALSAATDPDTTKDLIVGTSYPGRPIKIHSAHLRQFYDESEYPLRVTASVDYADLPNKTSSGTPNQIYYNRKTTSGDIRTWPIVDDPYRVLVLWVQVPLSDLESDTSINTGTGFPQEYFLAFSYSLAEAILPKYAPPSSVAQMIVRNAAVYRQEAFEYDTEDYVQFEPDLQRRGD